MNDLCHCRPATTSAESVDYEDVRIEKTRGACSLCEEFAERGAENRSR